MRSLPIMTATYGHCWSGLTPLYSLWNWPLRGAMRSLPIMTATYGHCQSGLCHRLPLLIPGTKHIWRKPFQSRMGTGTESFSLLIISITYTDRVLNAEVRNRIQHAIGRHGDILTTLKRRKLKRYGRVSPSPGRAKTILQGAVRGARRRERQRKRWEDNVREWTGLDFPESQRAVEDGKRWKQRVAKSSVVPQDR